MLSAELSLHSYNHRRFTAGLHSARPNGGSLPALSFGILGCFRLFKSTLWDLSFDDFFQILGSLMVLVKGFPSSGTLNSAGFRLTLQRQLSQLFLTGTALAVPRPSKPKSFEVLRSCCGSTREFDVPWFLFSPAAFSGKESWVLLSRPLEDTNLSNLLPPHREGP